jgi:IS66 C-terminal element
MPCRDWSAASSFHSPQVQWDRWRDHRSVGISCAGVRRIQTAKLNDVDPQAWLADVLARIADHKITDLAALLPWNWRRAISVDRAA